MEIVGMCRGELILGSPMSHVFAYLSDHPKILSFNPFCKRVTPTEREHVYRWDFEVADPQGHPIRLIFFVEQALRETVEPADIRIGHHVVPQGSRGGKIIWRDFPVVIDGKMPDDHTFMGKASGEMDVKGCGESETLVGVRMRIEIEFDIPRLFKLLPEPVLKKISEAAMTLAMQQVSNQMLRNIRRDFNFTVLGNVNYGSASIGSTNFGASKSN